MDRFGQHVTGFISGFDRLRFRATLRPLFQPGGMEIYLYSAKVLVKDFADFAKSLTDQVRKAAYRSFEQLQRPIRYLSDASLSKEDLARQLAKENGISNGPICLFSCLEPCLSFQLRGDRHSKELHLLLEHSRCTHLYHYYQHPQFGQLNIRVQTWFPFSVDICLNGRQWLAQQMDQARIAYQKRDNGFVWIQDCSKAQALLDQQLHSHWASMLDKLLELAHPLHRKITSLMQGLHYYWSASQSEYATDILFDQPQNLARLYPQFIHHALKSFQSPDVLRFLGNRHALQSRKIHPAFKGQVTTSLKQSQKAYDCVITSAVTPLRSMIKRVASCGSRPPSFIPNSSKSTALKKAMLMAKSSGANSGAALPISIEEPKSLLALINVTSRPWLASPAPAPCWMRQAKFVALSSITTVATVASDL